MYERLAGTSTPQPGTAPRLYQRVFEILAGQIEAGQIQPGVRLQESGVAAAFGISRAPARQALAELERSGLIDKAAGRGYTVRGVGSAKGKGGAQPLPLLVDAESRLVSASSWERIYGEVETEIVARIAFGAWRVNEAELARFYHVSRTVSRDVVGRLQQRGLLRKDDRARWYAPALTPGHVGELYQMRWLLEPVALADAAPRVPHGFLAEMRADLEDAIANAHAIGGATLDALESQMHIALLAYCGNQTLMQAITLHQSLLIAHRFLYRWTPRLFDTEPFLPEHLEIVDLLKRGKISKAAGGLDQHLRVSRDRAIARIDAITREFRPDELPYLERLAP